MRRFVDHTICTLLFSWALIGCATSPIASTDMGEGGAVTPPLGYIDFCARFPDQCGPETHRASPVMNTAGNSVVASRKYFWLTAFDGMASNTARPENRTDPAVFQRLANAGMHAASTPHMTKEFWSLLEGVNQDVNARIRPIHDVEQFGFEDYWTLPIATGTMAGDCKDYALEKRRILMAAGVPMSALSITLGMTSWGEHHAVLLVHSNEGDYVLDNLSPWVTPWKEVTYVWTKRQSTENPDIWVRPSNN